MISGRNILCISNPMWESDYAKTIVELMSVAARYNTVLYVDNSYTLKDIVTGFAKRRPLPYKRIFGLEPGVRKIPVDNNSAVYVLTTPMILPVNFLSAGALYTRLSKINGRIITRSIKKALKKLGMEKDLINIVAFNPAVGVECGRRFNEKLLIYHCYDDIESADWLSRHGGRLEKQFMKMADATIVTSEGLYRKKSPLAANCFLVKNAANIELFKAAFSATPATGNIIGYVGSVDKRMDYDLLEYLIKAMPDARFIFVGRITYEAGAGRLKQFPNVEFTGAKKVAELPALIASFTVGIIPFVKNEFTAGIYPLKVNEYLAVGIPVVSTNFGFLDDFSNIISISDTYDGFRAAVLAASTSDKPALRLQRLSFAEQNSWHKRVEELSDVINKLENKF
jgi:glycosyltransferase involved in cell wall biosynthesis